MIIVKSIAIFLLNLPALRRKINFEVVSCMMSLGLLLLIASPGMATDTLRLTFDNQSNIFEDSSPTPHVIIVGSFSEGSIIGQGVQWSDAAPQSPAGGGYAVFDGGSFLEIEASDDFVFSANEDFTVRFWFRSDGIDRGARFGLYRRRMHAMGFGHTISNSSGDNLDVDFDDPDLKGRGYWTYWRGGGSQGIRTARGTVGLFTDNRWYQYWLVRENGLVALYIRDENLNCTTIGTILDSESIGSPTGPNYIGRGSQSSFISQMGWLGMIDDVRIEDEAIQPETVCSGIFADGFESGNVSRWTSSGSTE